MELPARWILDGNVHGLREIPAGHGASEMVEHLHPDREGNPVSPVSHVRKEIRKMIEIGPNLLEALKYVCNFLFVVCAISHSYEFIRNEIVIWQFKRKKAFDTRSRNSDD